jgi:hypothetical protein
MTNSRRTSCGPRIIDARVVCRAAARRLGNTELDLNNMYKAITFNGTYILLEH